MSRGLRIQAVLIMLISPACSTGSKGIQKPFGYEPIYTEGSALSHFQDAETLISVLPSNIYGNEFSGYSFGANLAPVSVRTISYEVMFPDDFEFVKGGKLPGLCGGKNASGGNRATGTNGFSARLMWRKDGRIVSYVYHVGQKERFGDDFQWLNQQRAPIFARRGTWHRIRMTVGLNDVGSANGFIRGYFDGLLALEKNGLVFRTTDSIQVDRLCFNTFFGGDSASWAPKKTEKLLIRKLRVED